MGQTDCAQHTIDVGSSALIWQCLRKVPNHWRAFVEAELDRMLGDHLIEPTKGPQASLVVLIKKKDGSWKFCVDYPKLNAGTWKDAYPLPRMDDVFDGYLGYLDDIIAYGQTFSECRTQLVLVLQRLG